MPTVEVRVAVDILYEIFHTKYGLYPCRQLCLTGPTLDTPTAAIHNKPCLRLTGPTLVTTAGVAIEPRFCLAGPTLVTTATVAIHMGPCPCLPGPTLSYNVTIITAGPALVGY